MSGKLDSVMGPLATNLIADFGGPVTLTRTVKVYDPATGKTDDTATTFIVNMSPPAPYTRNRVNGTLIQSEDLWAYIPASASSGAPDGKTDQITLAGTVYKIVTVKPVYSGVQIAMYEVQLRR